MRKIKLNLGAHQVCQKKWEKGEWGGWYKIKLEKLKRYSKIFKRRNRAKMKWFGVKKQATIGPIFLRAWPVREV